MWGLSQKEKNARLHRALSERSPALVREAIQRGADPNALMSIGDYPLIWAARQYGQDVALKLCVALIEGGADVKVSNGGETPLSRVVASGDNKQLLEKLLDAGADVAAPAAYYSNVVEYALARSAWNMAEVLLERGLMDDIVKAGAHPSTALIRLISAGAPDKLLQKAIARCDVNETASDGRTALFQAVLDDRNAVVDALLAQSGVNVDAERKNGNSPLHIAIVNGRTEIAVKLIEHGADIFDTRGAVRPALQGAAARGDTQVLRAVIKRAKALGRVKELDIEGEFMRAASNGHYAVVLALGRETDVNHTDAFGQTAAIIAAKNGHTDVLKALARFGADMLCAGKDGLAPLACAIKGKHTDAQAFLETLQPGYVPPPPPPPPVDTSRFVKNSATCIDVREKGLTMTFNFWTQQLVYRDVEKNGAMVVQNFADVQRREAIIEAYDTLIRLGGTPPAPVFTRTPDKTAMLKIK